MKRVLAVLMVSGLAVGFITPSQAQDKLRIGVLDARKVIFESTQGRQQRAELEKLVKQKREQIAKEEAVFRALQEKLEKDKLVLTDKQKEQKEQELKEKFAALQKMGQEAQQDVAKRDNELAAKAQVVLRDIVTEVARQEKLSVVIDRNQPGFIWVEDPVDITDKVMKAYEAKGGK